MSGRPHLAGMFGDRVHSFVFSRIRVQLLAWISALLALISMFIFFYVPRQIENEALRSIEEKALSISNIASYSISPALLFNDTVSVRETFGSTVQDRTVLYLIVERENGKIFLSENGAGGEQARYDDADPLHRISADGLVFRYSVPIAHQGTYLGRLHIGISLDQVRERTLQSRNTVALISILIFVIGVLTAFSISAFVTDPLRAMALTAESIAQGNLTRRTTVSTQNEIGQLARAFNAMVDRLEYARFELENINRSLEQRVRERTVELMQEVSDRKRAEDQARQSEKRFRALIEHSSEGIILTDPAFTILYVGHPILDYEAADWEGRKVLELVHPDDQPVLKGLMASLQQSAGTIASVEFRARHKDGSWRWVEAYCNNLLHEPSVAAIVVNYREITARKLSDEAIRQSEERYRTLFEEDLRGDFVAREDGQLLLWNPAFARIFGVARDAYFAPIQIGRFFAQDSAFAGLVALVRQRRKISLQEIQMQRSDGTPVYVLASLTGRFDRNGQLVEVEGYLFDNSEQRMLEQELQRAQRLESLGTLAGGIAHDFNNLLGIVLGHISVIQTGPEEREKFDAGIDAIKKASLRGAGLIRQLLTFAQRAESQITAMQLNLVVMETVGLIEQTFPSSIKVVTALDAALPMINGDENQLHQVMLNLCLNARDAMYDGGTLRIASETIAESGLRQKFPDAGSVQYVHVIVQDSGIGMDDVTRVRVFEPFFTTKEAGRGTGLGLAVVFGIVKAHAGYIDIESSVGIGTTIHLYFPVAAPALAPVPKIISKPAIPSSGTETVLLIDDELPLRMVVTTQLTSMGYTVIGAGSAGEALRIFREQWRNIDLVISDVGLPGISGDRLLVMLLATNPDARVILTSGHIDPNVRKQIFVNGARGFVQKPFSTEELQEVIRRTLEDPDNDTAT